jgi:predicted transcriptional regulator
MTSVVRIFELPSARTEPERFSAYFHMVNRVIPADQQVECVQPETPARDALRIMREKGYSQIPVVQGQSVLGMFSYRAFALEALDDESRSQSLADLPVEEFLHHDPPTFARLTDEFRGLIEVLDLKDCVVVSGPEDLVAIITPMDVLRYLHGIANGFVLIEEIELALRALIRMALGEGDLFAMCIQNALSSKYTEQLPTVLEEMTFDDYAALLRDGRNWRHFVPVFGGTRERVRGKLEPIRDLRNDVFHFKRELNSEDRQRLAACRDWLLRCMRKVTARQDGSL